MHAFAWLFPKNWQIASELRAMRLLCSRGPEYCAVAISLEPLLKHSNHLFSQDFALGTHSFLFQNSDDNTPIYCRYARVF